MFDQARENEEYEFNAQFDYIREAYAESALDPWEEGYSDYVFNKQEAGEPVLDFAEWKAEHVTRQRSAPRSWTTATDECPF